MKSLSRQLGMNPRRPLGMSCRFYDEHMDLSFMVTLSWGPSGGLDAGQAFYIASHIIDGDPDSWVDAFANYGDYQNRLADEWVAKGWKRSAGEIRLKAFASYRSAWQFAGTSARFNVLYAQHQQAFALANNELELNGVRFDTPWKETGLPGHFFPHQNEEAPVVLVIGGADTCHEELFLTVGRGLLERGYSVALVDLPGQGNTQSNGLIWEADAEKSIGAVIDELIHQFRAVPGRIALIGLSLGGYFVCRAAGFEKRLATVIASTPLYDASELFSRGLCATGESYPKQPTPSALRSFNTILWKVGAATPIEFLKHTSNMQADARSVQLPFLSLLGDGESDFFYEQALDWHQSIPSEHKLLVHLPAKTGADGPMQLNNRLRLVQECAGWMDEIFDRH